MNLVLYIDGSVNTKTKVGYGAMLAISESLINSTDLKSFVKVKRFENTSSTKLELQTFLWAISTIDNKTEQIKLFTDCQNLLSLMDRKVRLKKNNYLSSENKLISNHQLYKQFYVVMDEYNIKLTKLKGHQKSSTKGHNEKIFTLVDKAARKALRSAF